MATMMEKNCQKGCIDMTPKPVTELATKLLPCPFCGSKARKTPNKGYISCENVDCLGEAFDAELWNKRYEKNQETIKELVGALSVLYDQANTGRLATLLNLKLAKQALSKASEVTK